MNHDNGGIDDGPWRDVDQDRIDGEGGIENGEGIDRVGNRAETGTVEPGVSAVNEEASCRSGIADL